jgi:hypothetical protein
MSGAIPLLSLRAFLSYDRVKPTHETGIVTNIQNVITSACPSVNYPFLLRFTVLGLNI